jgi:hypothetical protein
LAASVKISVGVSARSLICSYASIADQEHLGHGKPHTESVFAYAAVNPINMGFASAYLKSKILKLRLLMQLRIRAFTGL